MSSCPQCSNFLPDGAAFCPRCGTQLLVPAASGEIVPAEPVRRVVRLDRTAAAVPEYLRDRLDPEQIEAVKWSTGRCLILAGAGTGKTQTLTFKVAHLVACGVAPEQIALLTFTRRAATEMVARAQATTQVDLSGMLAGTFHHGCHLFLRKYASAVDLRHDFTILDEDDAATLVKIARQEHLASLPGRPERQFPSPAVLQRAFNLAVDTCQDVKDVVKTQFSYLEPFLLEVEAIGQRYAALKRAQNLVDYSDLLFFAWRLLEDHEPIRQRLAGQYRWVLVDEYQDTNAVQARIVDLLGSVHGNVIVVGDDSQAIYGWRGASYEHIVRFGTAPNARVFKIQTNYRATPPLIAFSNACIPNNVFGKHLRPSRTGGELPAVARCADTQAEAVFVAQQILALVEQGVPKSEIAVLFRAARHSTELQIELARRMIRFDVRAGRRVTELAHVKDALAFLRLVANPRDQLAWFRAVELFEGVGRSTAGRMYQELMAQADPFAHLASMSFRRAGQSLDRFRSLVSRLRELERPDEMLQLVLDGYLREYLRRQYPNAREREQDLERLSQVASRYSSVDRFLADLLLVERLGFEANGGEHEPPVVLSTIHQAKGLEWQAVFVLAVAPGQFPMPARSETEAQEERRVFYVAVTRARDHLVLCRPETRLDWGDTWWVRSGPDILAELPPTLYEEWLIE